MDPSEITDEDSLRAWLETQTREVAVTIAHRAAMRVAPAFWLLTSPCRRHVTASALAVCRPCLCAFLISFHSSSAHFAMIDHFETNMPGVKHLGDPITRGVSKSALWALGSAFRDGTERAKFASESVWEAAHVARLYQSREFWLALQDDIRAAQQPSKHHSLRSRGLWPDGDAAFLSVWADVSSTWRVINDPGWKFWADWYDAALQGRPLLGDWERHWDLLADIALETKPGEWDQGPDVVNLKVAEIYAEHADRIDDDKGDSDRVAEGASDPISLPQIAQLEAITEYGEDIVPNPETGLLRSEPKSELDDYHRDDVLGRLEDALANIDAAGGQNFAYAIILRDMDRLKRILTMRRDRPVRIYQVTLEVVHLIERRAENGECPALATDPDLSTLVRELYGAAATLQAHDPVVKRFNNPVLHDRVNDITDEQARNLGLGLARIPPVSEGLLKDEASEDAERLVQGESDPEIRRNRLIRSISRIVRVYGLVVRSSTANTIQLAAALYALEPALAQIIKWLFLFLR